MPRDDVRCDVIIPVRNGADYIADCLASIQQQLRPGENVVVVDDHSSDGTREVALRFGARVIGLSKSVGPYGARNEGVANSVADAVIFFDMRSRARPGWLDTHRRLLSEPNAAMSATDVWVRPGKSLASRVSALQQPYRISVYTGGLRPPYFATCNLGVKRDAFEAIGGFKAIRSGADADLCWRIQERGLGRLAISPDVFVEWIPRDSLRGAFEQAYRFGHSHWMLRQSLRGGPEHRIPVAPAVSRGRATKRKVKALFKVAKQRPRIDEIATLTILRVTFWVGFARAAVNHVRKTSPATPSAEPVEATVNPTTPNIDAKRVS